MESCFGCSTAELIGIVPKLLNVYLEARRTIPTSSNERIRSLSVRCRHLPRQSRVDMLDPSRVHYPYRDGYEICEIRPKHSPGARMRRLISLRETCWCPTKDTLLQLLQLMEFSRSRRGTLALTAASTDAFLHVWMPSGLV
jgi:hypothetical protein